MSWITGIIHSQIVHDIINDTLKREKNGVRRFSKTALIIANAWWMVILMTIWVLFAEGFRLDVYITLCSLATGAKLIDRSAKKIQPENIKE